MADTTDDPTIDLFVPWDDDVGAADEENEQPPPPPLDAGLLSWRMPPVESHSDWTLEISSTELSSNGERKEKRQTYHVHKNILSVGPKKSLYFERIFLSLNFAESETKTSKIELNEAAAKAFPFMLDFLYSREDKLELSTENATALHFLGQYFEIHRLRWETARFCKIDISMDNLVAYYEQGKLFHADAILKIVAIQCRKNLKMIGLESQLMELSDATLWRNIIHLFRQQGKGDSSSDHSEYLSRLIAKFCSSHRDLVDAATFTYFTDPIHMEEVDKDAAIPLLQLEGLFLPNTKTSEMLSNLQYRCIEAIASSWEDIDVSSLRRDLTGLNPGLFDFAFASVVEEAKFDKKQIEKFLVDRIAVSGAGMECVNGIYTRAEEIHNCAPVFTMKGTYFDNPAIYEIYLEGGMWTIGSRDLSALPEDSYHVFYVAPRIEGNQRSPVTNGWEAEDDVDNPAPTLRVLCG